MAKKMARKAKRKPVGNLFELTGTFVPSGDGRKPAKLTRGHITSRDHKDLSTYDLNCRIAGLMSQADAHDAEIERLSNELKARRASVKTLREDVAALEALVEGRR